MITYYYHFFRTFYNHLQPSIDTPEYRTISQLLSTNHRHIKGCGDAEEKNNNKCGLDNSDGNDLNASGSQKKHNENGGKKKKLYKKQNSEG